MFKLPEWGRGESSGPAVPAPNDPLAGFNSERAPVRAEPSGQKKIVPAWDDIADETGRRVLVVPLVLVFLLAVAGYFIVRYWPFSTDTPVTVTIESDPTGAEVFAAGTRVGLTPVKIPITPGDHVFELVFEGRKTPLHVTVASGAPVVHHVKFNPPVASVPSTKASLRVVTEPSKLRVLMNGKPLGVSPLLATDLEPGKHKIQVVGTRGTTERRVDLSAGEITSVMISAAPAPAPAAPARSGPSVGWVTITSGVPLQIVEGKDLIGTSQSARLMLSAGRHDILLSNESLGIVERRSINVTAGTTANIRVDVPNAPLSINALPWAEVWLDGKRLGETPIGNYPARVGIHEVVFRHPQFGERRKNVTVSLKGPSRVSVDLRQPQ